MRVFVNFRPEITDVAIVDRFKSCFRASNMFDDIVLSPVGQSPSADYPVRAVAAVAQCDAFIAIVRPGWADVQGARGRLIDDPLDPVRVEIIAALDRIMPMVPVLMDGATFPDPSKITHDLQALALREPVELRLSSLDRDFPRLLAALVPGVVDSASGQANTPSGQDKRKVSKSQGAPALSDGRADDAPGLARRLWGRRAVPAVKNDGPATQRSMPPAQVTARSAPTLPSDLAPPLPTQDSLPPAQILARPTFVPSDTPTAAAPAAPIQAPPVQGLPVPASPPCLVQPPQTLEQARAAPAQPPPAPELPSIERPPAPVDAVDLSPAPLETLPARKQVLVTATLETSNQVTAAGATPVEAGPDLDPTEPTKDEIVYERRPAGAFSKRVKRTRISVAQIVGDLDAKTRQIYARGRLLLVDQRQATVSPRAISTPRKKAESPSSGAARPPARYALVSGAIVCGLIVLVVLAGWVVLDFMKTQIASWRGLFVWRF